MLRAFVRIFSRSLIGSQLILQFCEILLRKASNSQKESESDHKSNISEINMARTKQTARRQFPKKGAYAPRKLVLPLIPNRGQELAALRARLKSAERRLDALEDLLETASSPSSSSSSSSSCSSSSSAPVVVKQEK